MPHESVQVHLQMMFCWKKTLHSTLEICNAIVWTILAAAVISATFRATHEKNFLFFSGHCFIDLLRHVSPFPLLNASSEAIEMIHLNLIDQRSSRSACALRRRLTSWLLLLLANDSMQLIVLHSHWWPNEVTFYFRLVRGKFMPSHSEMRVIQQ